MQNKYRSTMIACFVGVIIQAIMNNFMPLLFVRFNTQYAIPLSRIAYLVTVNFGIQLLFNFLAVTFVDRIGYRISVIICHSLQAVGLISMAILPSVMADPFMAILISVLIGGVGTAIGETIFSPMIEACPSENKERTMTLLHSFYCWGHVGVIILSTIFFSLFGVANWPVMTIIWALVPLANIIAFTKIPMVGPSAGGEKGLSVGALLKNRLFWLLMLLILCGGAAEQSVGQWASAFAEQGLKVSKTVGDLAGPAFFAVMMGVSRVIYIRSADRVSLDTAIMGSAALCIAAYLLVVLAPGAVISLIAFGICGLAVGIMWPGLLAYSSSKIPCGGTALFAILTMAGNIGCSAGPAFVGEIAGVFNDNLRMGILFACIFPVILLLGMLLYRGFEKKSE